MTPQPSLPLTTDRLIIRHFVPGDLDAISTVLDQAFGPALLTERQEWLDWTIRSDIALARLHQPPYGDRAIVLKSNTALVGTVGLVPVLAPFDALPGFNQLAGTTPSRRHTPQVGLFWALATAHRGSGYATEAARALIAFAFEALALRQIVALTERDNPASIAVMQRLGMSILSNPHPSPNWFQVVGVLPHPAG